MRVACKHLTTTYTSGSAPVAALHDLSFEIGEGEFVSIVGPSGCGKTSLLRTLAGLLPPSAGAIHLDGDRGDGSIGFVAQEDSLFPWMTAIENAAFALEMHGVSKTERETLARPVLSRFGLKGRERSYPHQLSAGMKQRVAVARAFLSRSTLLLMDEPFGALDAMTRQRLQQELLMEWTRSRRTVVFVTHDVEEAMLLGSTVLVMTPSPGSIAARYVVPFDYPRDFACVLSEEFIAMRREIHGMLGLQVPELERSK
jgi:ABC-type nitrate/sulfonate/bicarbonate transport system ATPase subunit